MEALPKLYKLTHESDIHNGYHFHEGLNVDPNPFTSKECSPGGFYLTTLENLPLWTHYNNSNEELISMTYIWDAEIVTDDQYQNEGSKFKAHSIRLSNKRKISECPEWKDYEWCKKACQINGWCLKYIQNPSQEMLEIAVSEDASILKLVKKMNLPESDLIAILEFAVRNDGYAIRFIQNDTEKIRRMAIEENPFSIGYIDDPSPSLQMHAVNSNPESLRRITNPYPEVEMQAVLNDPLVIRHISHPTKEIQMAAVELDGDALRFINNPDEEVQLAAIEEDSDAIGHIRNPNLDLQLKAVSKYGKSIRHLFAIPNFHVSLEVQFAAVRDCGSAIQFIPNPSAEVQIEAVKQNPKAIRFIQNPCQQIIEK